MTDLRPEALSWAALLGQWMEYAQAAVAQPDDAEGRRWQAAVPHVIELQAVIFALHELGRVARADRPVARDRAAVLVRRAAGALRELWGSEPLPGSLLELFHDATRALEFSIYAGAVELVWAGGQPRVMPALEGVGEDIQDLAREGGTLLVMMPGTLVMPGEPIAWWLDRPELSLAGGELQPTDRPRQVYRQLDSQGRIVEDVVAPVDSELPPGMPLLVPLVEDGRAVGHFPMSAEEWLDRQRRAMTGGTIPVRFVRSRAVGGEHDTA